MCPGAQDLGQPGLTRQATLPADDIVWSKPPHIPGQPIPIPPRNEPHLFISVVDDIVHSKDTLAASQSNSSNGGKNDAKPNRVGSLKVKTFLFLQPLRFLGCDLFRGRETANLEHPTIFRTSNTQTPRRGLVPMKKIRSWKNTVLPRRPEPTIRPTAPKSGDKCV